MSETDDCTPEKLLEGFSKMSLDDQEKVRTLLGIATSNKTEPCCDAAAMMGMMGKCSQTGCTSSEETQKE